MLNDDLIIVTEANKVKDTIICPRPLTDDKFIQACKDHAGLRKDWAAENLIDGENAPNLDEGIYTSDNGLTTVQVVQFINM